LELRFPPEYSWAYLASRAAEAANRLLSWASAPFSTCRTWGSTLTAGLPHPLRSAFRVWLPSWRFTPPESWSALSHADSAPGIQPFGAFSSRKVPRMFPSRANPRAVHLPLLRRTNPRGDPTSRDFWVLTLSRVPRRTCEANTDHSRMLPWGLVPSRVSHRTPDPRSLADSSLALGSPSSLRHQDNRCLRVSIGVRLARRSASRQAERRNRATLLGFLHRFAPTAQTEDSPGYEFTSQVSRYH